MCYTHRHFAKLKSWKGKQLKSKCVEGGKVKRLDNLYKFARLSIKKNVSSGTKLFFGEKNTIIEPKREKSKHIFCFLALIRKTLNVGREHLYFWLHHSRPLLKALHLWLRCLLSFFICITSYVRFKICNSLAVSKTQIWKQKNNIVY